MRSDEMPDGEAVDSLARRDAIDLKALDDILRGAAKPIAHYYGEGATEPSRDSSYWAEVVVKNSLRVQRRTSTSETPSSNPASWG